MLNITSKCIVFSVNTVTMVLSLAIELSFSINAILNVFGKTRELGRCRQPDPRQTREETKAGSWIRLDRKVINTARWR